MEELNDGMDEGNTPTSAGWYSDPEGKQPHQAYWNGAEWTGKTRHPSYKPPIQSDLRRAVKKYVGWAMILLFGVGYPILVVREIVLITTTDYYCCGEVEAVIAYLGIFGGLAAVIVFFGVRMVRSAKRP